MLVQTRKTTRLKFLQRQKFGSLSLRRTITKLKNYLTKLRNGFNVTNTSKQVETVIKDFDIKNADEEAISMRIGGLTDILITLYENLRETADQCHGLKMLSVKGILLNGPPGTGKTLIAKNISRLLGARETKIVDGRELLLNGKAEKKVKNLCEKAKSDYRRYGECSPVHVIIFDDIDSMARRTMHGNATFNHLLNLFDRIKSYDNVLVLAATNRLDLIDPAILGPGRLELRCEMPLPNYEGRIQILEIHAGMLREDGVLDPNVNFSEIAHMTSCWSPADIAGLVRSALNRSIFRVARPTLLDFDEANIHITKEDFIGAIEEKNNLIRERNHVH